MSIVEAISKKRGKLMTQGRLFSERSPKDKNKILARLVFLWLFLQTDGSSVASVNFYVSVSGKDQWSGRSVSPNGDLSDGPFATLQRARDAIRQLKMSKGLPEGGITVWITKGTYCLEQGLKLTAED